MACGDFKDLQEEQLQIKFKEIKHLILLKIQTMTGIKEVLFLLFINFFDKKTRDTGVNND